MIRSSWWEVSSDDLDSYRLDAVYYKPAFLKVLNEIKKQEYKNLEEIATIIAPRSVRKAKSVADACPTLSVRDTEAGIVIPHVPRYLETITQKNCAKSGDVIMTKTGVHGIAAAVLSHESFWAAMSRWFDTSFGLPVTSDILIIRPEQDELNSAYLACFLTSPVGRILTKRLVYGIGPRHLTKRDLAKVPIPLPDDKMEQRAEDRIARFYEAYNTVLDHQDRIFQQCNNVVNKYSQIMKQGHFESPIDVYRFDINWPIHHKIASAIRALGDVVELGELAKVVKPSSPNKAETGLLVLGTRDIKPNIVLPRGEKPRIVERVPLRNWAKSGSLLVTEVGGEISVGTATVVPHNLSLVKIMGFTTRKSEVAVSGDFLIILPEREEFSSLMSIALNSPVGRTQIKTLKVVTKQNRLRHYEADKLLIPNIQDENLLHDIHQSVQKLNEHLVKVKIFIEKDIPKQVGLSHEELIPLVRHVSVKSKLGQLYTILDYID